MKIYLVMQSYPGCPDSDRLIKVCRTMKIAEKYAALQAYPMDDRYRDCSTWHPKGEPVWKKDMHGNDYDTRGFNGWEEWISKNNVFIETIEVPDELDEDPVPNAIKEFQDEMKSRIEKEQEQLAREKKEFNDFVNNPKTFQFLAALASSDDEMIPTKEFCDRMRLLGFDYADSTITKYRKCCQRYGYLASTGFSYTLTRAGYKFVLERE